MTKFIVLAAVFAVVAGEAPPHVGLSGYSNGGSHNGGYSNGGSSNGGFSNGGSNGGSGINEYVDEALLARVGELIARGGDGSGTPQGTEGQQLDTEILTRVSGSLGDDAANGPSPAYGPPSRNGGAQLGNPEPAERIAEFDLTDSAPGAQQGGYDSAPAPAPGPQYGAPAPGRGASPLGAQISLGRPEAAQRVADFSLQGQSTGPARQNGGYN